MQLLFETIKKQYFKFTFFCFSFSPILTQALVFLIDSEFVLIYFISSANENC